MEIVEVEELKRQNGKAELERRDSLNASKRGDAGLLQPHAPHTASSNPKISHIIEVFWCRDLMRDLRIRHSGSVLASWHAHSKPVSDAV